MRILYKPHINLSSNNNLAEHDSNKELAQLFLRCGTNTILPSNDTESECDFLA